jgi:hypothetical protein
VKPLDYISQELQRVQGRLDKILPEANNLEAERDQLVAARIVIQRAAGAVAVDGNTPAPAPRRGRPAGTPNKPKGDDGKPSLSDSILTVVGHMPAGGSKEDITQALQVAGIAARANHIGIALNRHLRGGRLTETDGRWSVPTGAASNGEDSHASRPAAASHEGHVEQASA